MRDALPGLGLAGPDRCDDRRGGDGTRRSGLATGDAVKRAARLEQAAQPGEVLNRRADLALVGARPRSSPVDPLELKGKAEPVPPTGSWRARRAEPRHARFVGRERELAIVREAWARV
jgi:class 3 adenylate cyclase